MEELNYKLEVFDGPLDLLLSLIAKNKINIYDIPISEILEQYLAYMEQAAQLNIELSSEFVVMACELLYIKSRMLLPREAEDQDPRSELVEALLEYSKVKDVADYLFRRKDDFFERYRSAGMKIHITKVLRSYSPQELAKAYANMKMTAPEVKKENNFRTIGAMMQHRVIPVEEKIIFILRRLCRIKNSDNSMNFSELVGESKSKSEVVAVFLAALELTKSGRIRVTENGNDYKIKLIREKKND
ncbi:MAG: chromosome segregation protein ScpA [Ruminococcaceae bacterium]|nr:chromosome segregation protein ScpA [Oscillospiraceae bacterium]